MRTFLIILISALTFIPVSAQDDYKAITSAVSLGSAEKLAIQFNNSVEIILPGSDKVYTKSQGQMVMKDFFKKNQPTKFTILHKGSRENSQFFIGTLETKEAKTYRITFLLKENNKKQLISQIRIQQ